MVALPTFAGDSTWYVSNSKSFLVSALGHRTRDESRQTEITFIYGAHIAKGVLYETSDKVSLRSETMKLDGVMTLNFATKQMTMDGQLYIGNERYDIEEVLRCKDKTQTRLPGSSGY